MGENYVILIFSNAVLFVFVVVCFSGPNTSLYERARSKSNGKRKVRYCSYVLLLYENDNK